MTLNQAFISEITLNQTTASVVIPVPTGYSDLRLVMSLRSSNTEGVGVIYFNSDTTNTNYTVRRMLGEGSGTPSSAGANYPYIYYMNPSNDTANAYSNHEVYISDYLSSNPKTFLATGARENNGTYGVIAQVPGKWSGTAAINSLTIKPYNEGGASFAAGCTFTLYGISKLGVTPTQTPKATGGDIIKNDGTYWYHAFLSTGQFIPQTTLSADVLVVAGGGGSQANSTGGGGAGGLLAFSSQSLTSNSSYACTVGAGGAGGGVGSNGSNSQFASLTTCIGGGKPGYGDNLTGSNGGSGGGGGGYSGNGTPGSGTSGQGTSGAVGRVQVGDGTEAGGGGGGAGQAGGYTGRTWDGGIGATSSLINAIGAATGTGQLSSGNYYFAGGGGGYNGNNGNAAYSQGLGGKGGGGNGTKAQVANGTSGAANTGGGAGGGWWDGAGANTGSYNGGSGIIIIRYAMA